MSSAKSGKNLKVKSRSHGKTTANNGGLKWTHHSKVTKSSIHAVHPLTKAEMKKQLQQFAQERQKNLKTAKNRTTALPAKKTVNSSKYARPDRHDGYEEKSSGVSSKERTQLSNKGGNKSPLNHLSHFQIVRNSKMASAGYGGMRNIGTGTITLSGVGGTITKAYLYWHGPTNTVDPSANDTVEFGGTTIMGENIGFSSDNCWGFLNSQAYRADVTSLVTGNGDYSLSRFIQNDANINGVSLIVFYNDSVSTTNRDFVIFDGNDSNIGNPYDETGWDVVLPGINYDSGSAQITLHVSDGQHGPSWNDDNLYLNGSVLAAGPDLFNGTSVPNGAAAAELNGGLWDILSFDITSFLGQGLNNLTLTTGDAGDCLSLIVAIIDLPAGSAPTAFGTAKIEGMKFADSNNNGVKDSSDTGLTGWPIVLDSLSGTPIETTYTNPLGQYELTDILPGTYLVSEMNKTGWVQTYPAQPGTYTVTVDSGEIALGKDFGNYAPPSSIQGMKFNDMNGNGIHDSLETGIAGWTITLDGPVSLQTTTDSVGNYIFANLLPGLYFVDEASKPGWIQTTPESHWSVEIDTPGSVIVGKDFGNWNPPPGVISGMKFNDLNGDGVKDSTEPGLPGWTILLYSNSTGETDTAYTDSSGHYSFTNVMAGDYAISEVQQTGWLQTYPLGYAYDESVRGDSLMNRDFGNYLAPPSGIFGMKFSDLNGDGSKDTTDPGLAAWKIVLFRFLTEESDTTMTDTLGMYSFTNLPPGQYQVSEVQQNGWNQTCPTTEGGSYSLNVFGDTVSNTDFGNRKIVTNPFATDRGCVNFGTVKLGDSLTLPLTLLNYGYDSLVVDSIGCDNPAFAVLSAGNFAINPLSSFDIPVGFTPVGQGDYSGTLSLYVGENAYFVSLSGQGELTSGGDAQEIFSGLVTLGGELAPQYTVVGAYRTTGELIKATVVKVPPDSVQDRINYALSILVGQAGVSDGDTIVFKVSSLWCDQLAERYCPPQVVFHPAFPPPQGYIRHDVDAVSGQSLTLQLVPGYNAISWNVLPQDAQVATIFADPLGKGIVKIILGFVNDGSGNTKFDFYIPELGQYNPLLWTDFTQGYFVKILGEAQLDTFSVCGMPVCPSIPVPLNSGYNFVSYLEGQPDSVGHALGSLIPGNLGIALRYTNDGAGNEAFHVYPDGDFSVMMPGEGYFVKVDSADVLVYPGPPTKALPSRMKTASVKPRHTSGTVSSVPSAVFAYGLHVQVDGKPVPAGTEIKAVDKDGVVCGKGKFAADGVFGMAIYGDDPKTAKDEGASPGEMVSIYIGNKLISQRVKWTEFGDTPQLEGNLTVTNVTFGSELPKEFALHQNYPNPFNPTTSITYELPKSASVTLKIYNLLGAEVRTLVTETQGAGYYQVVWDGRNNAGSSVASGIYTYRLTANSDTKSFVQTHKMILMK
jgi:hypothetical protein